MHEFDGLSIEEKLAYLDLQLTNLYGDAWRERREKADRTEEHVDVDAIIH